ncbi:hypothetical protein ACOSQ4_003228 [Xanthoceras sorbifolium]
MRSNELVISAVVISSYPRVPPQGSSTEGESGPKIRPKGVVDGQQDARCPCFFRVRRGRENAPSQCSSTRRYGAEVTHAILPGKARTTFNKRELPIMNQNWRSSSSAE